MEVLRRCNYDWMLTGRKLIRSNALSAKRQQGLIIRDAGTSILPTLRASALLQTINIPEKSWTNWWRKTGRKPDINMPNGRKRSSEGWQSILLIQEINRDMMRRKRNGRMWDSAQVISIQLNIWTKKRCKFLGAPEDITSVWTLNGEKEKRQIDLFRFTHLTFIDEIGLYKDKQIIGIYKRNKKNKSRSSVQSLWIMGTVNNSYLLVFYNNICECAIFLIIAPAQIILYCLVIYLLPCRFFWFSFWLCQSKYESNSDTWTDVNRKARNGSRCTQALLAVLKKGKRERFVLQYEQEGDMYLLLVA